MAAKRRSGRFSFGNYRDIAPFSTETGAGVGSEVKAGRVRAENAEEAAIGGIGEETGDQDTTRSVWNEYLRGVRKIEGNSCSDHKREKKEGSSRYGDRRNLRQTLAFMPMDGQRPGQGQEQFPQRPQTSQLMVDPATLLRLQLVARSQKEPAGVEKGEGGVRDAAFAPLSGAAQPAERGANRATGLGIHSAKAWRRTKGQIEAVLDLHGLSLNEAEFLVKKSIYDFQSQGKRFILVISGKGSKYGSNGVIRKMVVQTLHDMSSYVVHFTPAEQKDGGTGAWYVFLRRKR